MTIEQITAINNGMSMLANLYEAVEMVQSLDEFEEYTNRHIKALKDANVDNLIVEHFESVCCAYYPIVESNLRHHGDFYDL